MKIKIIAAMLTHKYLELVDEEGESIYIQQGHPNLQMLVDKVLPVIQQGATVEIDDEVFKTSSIYKEVSEKSNGVIRFFRIAKEAFTKVFQPQQSSKDTIYEDPAYKDYKDFYVEGQKCHKNLESQNPDFTVVANVDDNYMVPGMEKLISHMNYALKHLTGIEAFIKFLKRVASVQDTRPHSVEDLLTFMEHGDLPIADDGYIIIYKGLNYSKEKDVYVDSYSGNVKQKVGSKVFMHPSLVDLNRNCSCSDGLHVARKGYLKTFQTDVIALCKVDPKDVIVVPHGEPDKMRVSAYQIFSILPHEAANRVRRSEPFDDIPEAAQQLAQAKKAGSYIPITNTVEICGKYGTEIVYSNFDSVDIPKNTPCTEQAKNVTEQKVEFIDAPKVDIMETIEKVKDIRKFKSRAEEVQFLTNIWENETDRLAKKDTLREIFAITSQCKKSLKYLGISKETAARMREARKYL